MRRRHVVAILGGLFACALAAAQAPTLPAAPTSTTITPGGATATTVTPVTGATQVSTATISGGNAYNQFSAFQIAPGDTVDLVVPTAATNNNLLNLVSGSATQIYGTLNSLLQADGKIGGNIFFADPSGVIVGASGVVNVGSLTFATPSSDFVNNFFSNVSGNTASLLAGTEPLSSDGLIAVLGQVNAAGPATLTAPTVAVSGGIATGAAQFGSLVNTTGLQSGQAISINGNSITIDGGLFGGAAPATLNAGPDDITLTASPSDSEALASAVANITLGAATLTGNNITAQATASATSNDSISNTVTQALTDTSSLPWNILDNLAAWNTASSNAAVNLGTGSGVTTINALGNVKLAAEADSTTTINNIEAVVGLNYGEADTTTTANLGSNANVTAGGSFTLSTLNNDKLAMTPTTAGSSTPAVSVSYGKATSASTSTLAGTVHAASVGVTADNENSFYVTAGDSAGGGGPAGVGVAIGDFSSQANAILSGSATATGADLVSGGNTTPALNLSAISNNSMDSVSASSETTNDSTAATITNAATGGVPFLGDLANYISGLGSSKVNSEDNNSSPLGIAAAVAYSSSTNTATTTESGTAAATAGTAGLASSATDEPQVGAAGTAGDATASIGGGVAIGNFSNTANTTVNGSVTGDQGVNISAIATLPNPFNLSAFTSIPSEFSNFQFVAPSSITDTNAYQKDWNAAQALGGDLVNVLNPKNTSGIGQFLNSNLGIGNLVNTFVETGASGKSSNGGSGFGLAGSVDILGITNQATTDVANGADVTANNNGVNVNANSNAFLINVAGMAFDLGQLKDKNPGASGDAALGGTYLGLNLTNSAIASIDDGAQVTAQNGGAVNVGGTTNETLIDIAQAGDNAGKFGINGTFNWVTLNNTAEGYIQSNAVVDAAGAVNVNGANTLNAFTIGGALGYGGSAEIGATVAWNQLTNNTLAYIGDPSDARTSSTGSVTAGSGGVNLNANTNDTLWNISLAAELATGQKQDTSGSGNTSEGGGSGSGGSGGSGSFGLGISGNVSINDITDTTQAYINNAANIYTPGTVGVTAQDNSFAVSGGLAFALAASGDGTGITLGGAFARNDFTKTTESWIDNALVTGVLNAQTNTHAPAGGLNLQATSTGNLLTISAGASISTGDGVGIAGSANNNVLTNTTEAGLGTGANVDVSGAATIAATQHDRALAIAGALSYAGNVGVGAALDYSNYTNTTKGYIDDGAALTAGGDISVTASTDEQLLPIIASLGASDNVGLAGAASKDEIQNDTEATIGAAKVNTDSSLVLGADDNSQLLLIVGSLGGAGDVGVGVSGAISTQSQPLFDRTVKATVAQGAEVQTEANGQPVQYQGQDYFGLLADATAEGGADTIVAGVGGAGDVGIAASLALNYFTEDVEATVDGSINPGDAANNKTLGHQGVAVNANDSSQILDVAGNIAASGAVSVGAAADVQFLTRTVKAEIGGNVQSNANIAATATQGGSDWSVAGAGSFSGSVNIAGSASALFDTSKVTADIAPGAVVYTPGSIDVAAARTENINTIDGELGISGDVGVGASLSLLEQNDTTTADVGAGAQVTALGEIPMAALVNVGNDVQNGQLAGLAVTANANDTLLTIAAGGQASLGVSLAGSVVLNDISDTTDAYVDSGAVINAASGPAGAPQQAVEILANDGTNLTSGAGALAVGINIYGVGLGVAVNLEGAVSQLPSVASGFQSSLTGDLNGVSDNAASGVPGGFSKNTSAGVNNGATVNAASALTIAALSSETLNNYDAAIGGGIAGLAGSVELDDYTPTTTAYFGQCASAIACSGSSGAAANVGSASVKANDTLNYFSVVGAAEAGGGALGAAVLDATVGADTSAYVGAYSSLTANKGVAVNSNFTDNYSSAVLAGGAGGIVANVPYATITDQSDNSAFIADNATVAGGGGPVSVHAVTQRTVTALSGAAVAGGLGIGATILDVNFYGSTAADIAPGATVSSGNAIRVLAQLDDSVPQYLNLPSDVASALSKIPGINGSQIPTGILGATVAGLAGIGGQVTITDNARDTAFVVATSLTAGDGISVTADDEPNLWAQSAAAEAGLIGAGASISDINLAGAVSAIFNTDATATHGNIQVASTLAETLNGDATGIGGGLATGNGTVVNINDGTATTPGTTNSVLQGGSATAPNGDASFIANTTRNAYANAGSTNVGLLAVGISFADVNLYGSTSAELNGNVTANAASGTATLTASNKDHATVDAIVDAKGGVNGIGAMAGSPNGLSATPSRIDPAVTVNIGSGAKVNANTINILANDSSNLSSTASGGSLGFIKIGLLDAEGVAAPQITLNMDGSLSGGLISVKNTGSQSVTSDAEAPLSSSLLSAYSTTDGANSNPSVHLNFNGSAAGAAGVTIESDSNSTVSAKANAAQQFGTIAILAGGLTTSNAGINNTNIATAYGTISSSQGDVALNAVSVNNVTQNDATGGTGNGVAEGGLVYATTKVYDTTHANLDAAFDALAGTASVLASSVDNATSDAYISSSGWSGIDYVQSNGYTGVNASPVVNVDGGANIQADIINVTATLPAMMSGANATAQAQKGFAGDGYAYSDFEGIFNPTIEVHGGAQLTAPTIDILANVGTPAIPLTNGIFGASDATAGTQSATGTASANATNNATLFPGVKLDSGSTLTTNNLKVQALYPLIPLFGSTPSVSGVSTVTWVAEQVQEVVDEVVGWIPFVGNLIEQATQTVTKWVEQITNSNVYANSYGTFEPGSAITVDSTIQQLGSSNGATLTVGANGQPTTADGLSIQNEDNNSILVNSLINTSNPLQITLDTTGGTVGGTPTIIENNMPPFVNITNDSNLNLILQQLSPIGGSGGNPPISITADNASQFNPNFVENQTPTAITIANNGSGDVLFTNVIADQPGSITVNNLGGNILGTVNSQLDANQLALDAPHGSIGSNAGTIYACPLCPVTSQNGDVMLGPLTLQPDEVALAANSAPVVPTVSAVAVGDINLNLTPSEPVANGIASGAPSVDLTNILAGGNANITLNPATVSGVELVPVTINFFGTQLTFDIPEPVNGPAPNTDYNVGPGQWLAAGGNLNLNFGGAHGSQVTLNDNGLVASGFEGINFALGLFDNPISNVVADNQTNYSLLNYLVSLSGAPVLSNLNASSGGHVVFAGSGAVAGNGTIAVLDGQSNASFIDLFNLATPTVQSILDPGVNTSSISIFGNNQPLSGTLAGSSVSLGSYGVPGGEIALQSSSGLNLTGALLAPLGVIQAVSQGDLNGLSGVINGGTLVNLTSNSGSLLLGPINVPAGNLIATAAGDIFDPTLITAGNATLNAKGGSITLQQATIGNIVNLIAAQNITAGAITAGGAANLNAQNGSIVLNQSLAANGVTAAAGQDITSQGTLLSLGDATLNAAHGSIDANGPIAIQGNASLTAGGNITLQALTAGQSALLRALAGDINLGNLSVANGPALLTAGGSIAAANGSIVAATDATLQAKSGDILLGALFAGNNANLNAGGSIDAGAGVLQAGNSATLDAGNAITLGQLTAGQNASLSTAAGDINLGAVTATAGDATLTAGGNINAANGSVSAGSDASLTANQNISLGTVEAGQNATLQSSLGDINLGQVTATAGDAALTAGGNINAQNGTVSAGHDAALTAGSLINLGAVAAGNNATLSAGASIDAASGSVTAGNNATLAAADNIVLGTVTATAGNAQITAQNGFLDFGTVAAGQNATLTAGQDMNAATGTVQAGNDAALTAGGSINALGLQVNAGHDATLTATTGSINTGNASITAGNDANLTAAQNITLGTVLAGNNATLAAQAGDINLGSVTATAGDATLTAGNSINAASGAITAGTDANLTAGQNITLGTVLAGNNATLAAQAGDINLGSVTATAGDATLTAGNSINAATGAITAVTAGTDATLTAQNGDINLGTVTAGNNATLTANDNINIGAAGSVTAGSTATLTTLVNDINLLGTVTAPTAVLTANHSISGGGTVIANVTQLAAETGAIGTTGGDLNVEMNTLNGVVPTLSAAARNDINLNLTAIDPPGPAGSATDTEATHGQPTLFANLVSIIAGGNLNLNLNQGSAAGSPENAWYEIPQGDLAIAGGNVTVNEAAPIGDYAAVTLDVDGLLASGFQSLNYTISPTGAWSTTVGIAGQTATGPVNFGTIANGVINLSDINAAQGGQIAITGTGQLGNARNLVAFSGVPSVTVNNLDPNLTLQVNDVTLGLIHGGVQWAHPRQGSGIRFVEGGFGGHEFGGQPGGKDDHGKGDDEHNNGNEVHGPNAANNAENNPDGGWGQGGDGGQNAPTLTLDSAGGVVLAGHISNQQGSTTISGQTGISGSGLTESQVLDLASLDGGIGAANAPLAVGIGNDGQLNASAAGDIAIAAPAGNLPLGTITTPGDIYLSTPAGSIDNAVQHENEPGFGKDLDGTIVNNLSGNNITLTASGSIGEEDRPLIGAATGTWTLSAGDDLNLTSGANMNVASLTAEDANLNVDLAGGSLTVAQALISDSLNAQADNIAIASLSHADPVNPLNLSLTGNDGRMAQSINVAVTSAAPVLVGNYSSQTGGISLAGDWLEVDHASIGQSASFQNSWLNVALANTDKHGHAEDATLDMVGNLLSSHADHDLTSIVTQLQPGQTFTLPSQLTPTQERMVDGLHLDHADHGRH